MINKNNWYFYVFLVLTVGQDFKATSGESDGWPSGQLKLGFLKVRPQIFSEVLMMFDVD